MYHVKQVTGRGDVVYEGNAETHQEISARLSSDYAGSVQRTCEDADKQPGEWLEIIMGPPELADAVDRLRVRRMVRPE